jgi:hypothetical protein
MPKLNFFNNTGGLNNFSSMASLNQSENNTDWFDAQNIEGHKSGGLIKMKGNKNILTTSLPAGTKVLGIWDYTKQGNHYPIIITSEGKLYRLNLTTGVLSEKYSGLNHSAKCNFVNFNNGVIISNGVDTPVFYEEFYGVTPLPSSAPAGIAIKSYKARVFIAAGSGLYYSALGNPYDWTTADDAGSIVNFHNDSSPILALENYGEFLAIYKKNGIYVLSGSAPENFVIKPVADKGCISPFAIGTVNNHQYFFNGESITTLNFNSLGQITIADDVSIKIKSIFPELNTAKFNEVVCIPYQQKNQVWYYFASETSDNLDVCYIYDYFHKSWYKRVGLPITCGTCIDEKIYSGTADGRVLLEDTEDSFDGEDIKAWWLSPWFTFGNPDAQKEILAFNIWLYQNQKYPFDVIYAKDFSPTDRTYTNIEITDEEELVWDTGEWGVHNWASNKAVRKKIPIAGTCEALQIGFQNLEAGQYFSILGYSFEYEVADV